MNTQISFYIAQGRKPQKFQKAFFAATFAGREVEFGHSTWRQFTARAKAYAARYGFAGRVAVTVYA